MIIPTWFGGPDGLVAAHLVEFVHADAHARVRANTVRFEGPASHLP
jgi:hypothetical protein